MGLQVYIDGKYFPEEDAKISVWDHGFLYGDGVFEGIRAYNQRVFKLDEHLKRLYESARAIMLNVPLSQEELKKAVVETCAKNSIGDGYIRLIVTRGKGDLGLDPVKCCNASIIIIADTISIYPQDLYLQGMKVVTVSTRRNSPQALSPRIKSLNYLNNILGRIEVNRAGADEGLMLSLDGFVAECVADNIFIVKDGVIQTPSTAVGALKGVTRDCVIEIAKEAGYEVQETIMTLHDVYVSDECFVTGTAAEIAPIVMVDDRAVNDGLPGSITKELMEKFHAYVRNEGTPIYEG